MAPDEGVDIDYYGWADNYSEDGLITFVWKVFYGMVPDSPASSNNVHSLPVSNIPADPVADMVD